MIGFWLVILDGYSTTKQNDLDLVQMGIIRILKFMRKLSKRRAFITILGACVILPLLYQCIWIFSRAAMAEVYAADAVRSRGRFSMEYAEYQVGTAIYHGSYFRDEHDVASHSVYIRYLVFSPDISRKNSFAGNWGYPLMFIVFFSLVTCVIFIRKDIFSDQAVFVFQGKRPFIKLEKNNPIEDFDVHDMESGQANDGEVALRQRLESQADLFKSSKVSTSVYKFNPNAIAIFIGYLVLFFLFFKTLLTEMSVGPGIIILGVVLVFVPLFVQNTNTQPLRRKYPMREALFFRRMVYTIRRSFIPLVILRRRSCTSRLSGVSNIKSAQRWGAPPRSVPVTTIKYPVAVREIFWTLRLSWTIFRIIGHSRHL